jgi:hypothetical protein
MKISNISDTFEEVQNNLTIIGFYLEFFKNLGVINCSCNSSIVQNLYSKTFHYKNNQKGKTVLFFILKIKNHLINTLSYLSTFCSIKSVNFNTEMDFF